jgi:hypothetical protein
MSLVVRVLSTLMFLCAWPAAGPNAFRTLSTVTTAAVQQSVKVWVNTKSGVYHCPGTRYYGNTKAGKFMPEAEARATGNRPAYGQPCGPSTEANPAAPQPLSSEKPSGSSLRTPPGPLGGWPRRSLPPLPGNRMRCSESSSGGRLIRSTFNYRPRSLTAQGSPNRQESNPQEGRPYGRDVAGPMD